MAKKNIDLSEYSTRELVSSYWTSKTSRPEIAKEILKELRRRNYPYFYDNEPLVELREYAGIPIPPGLVVLYHPEKKLLLTYTGKGYKIITPEWIMRQVRSILAVRKASRPREKRTEVKEEPYKRFTRYSLETISKYYIPPELQQFVYDVIKIFEVINKYLGTNYSIGRAHMEDMKSLVSYVMTALRVARSSPYWNSILSEIRDILERYPLFSSFLK